MKKSYQSCPLLTKLVDINKTIYFKRKTNDDNTFNGIPV